MRSFSGCSYRFRPVGIGLLVILILCCGAYPAGAADPCGFTPEDCPACPAGGLSFNDSSAWSVDARNYATTAPYEGLTCTYGNPLSGNTVSVKIECYQDAGVAEKWYQYYRQEIPYPYPETGYGSGYASHTQGHRVFAQADIFGTGTTRTSFRTAYQDWDYARAGRYGAEITSLTPTDTITQDEASAQNIARIQEFSSCLASFRPSGAPMNPDQQLLKGTITATSYPAGIPQPLRYARVTLLQDGKNVLGVVTDAEGKYTFAYAFQKGKTYRLEIGLGYTRGDKEYFTLYYHEPVEEKKVVFRHDFTYTRDTDLDQDVNLDDLWKKRSDTVNPFGIMYIHFTEAAEFYADYLSEDIRLNLPLKIVAFSTDATIAKDRARYESDGTESVILISPRESIPESELRPVSREYHEFSHYMMANTWGREPVSLVTGHGDEVNHGGFLNPSTTDSWAEGVAHFMAGAIGERTQIAATAGGEATEPCDGASYYGVLEDNYRPWDYGGRVEEAAIAGTLWDLFDSPGQKQACEAQKVTFLNSMASRTDIAESTRTLCRAGVEVIRTLEQRYGYQDDSGYGYEDKAGFTLPQLWAVLRAYHPDMLSFYEGLTRQYPGSRDRIDDVFLMHGFWKESSAGNGQYDREEPFRDANGNNVWDAGEFYIDLADRLEVSPGDTPGTAADAGRPWRRTTLQLPGQFVKVNNRAPSYSYTVEYPGTNRWPHTNYAVNTNGLVFVPVPPDPAARITVRAIGAETGSPLVFTPQQFHNTSATAVRQGYFASHDFQLKGPVPPPPAVPDPAGTGPGPGDLRSVLLTRDGPLNSLLFGTERRIPLTLSIPVVLLGLAVLVWRLRKE